MTGGLTQITLACLCASQCAIPMLSKVRSNSALGRLRGGAARLLQRATTRTLAVRDPTW
jgi:hypothetical protein